MVERVAVVYNTLTAILIKIFRDYNFLKTGLNKQDPPTHYNMILQRGTVTILKYHRRSLTDSAEVGLSLTETEIQQYKIFKWKHGQSRSCWIPKAAQGTTIYERYFNIHLSSLAQRRSSIRLRIFYVARSVTRSGTSSSRHVALFISPFVRFTCATRRFRAVVIAFRLVRYTPYTNVPAKFPWDGWAFPLALSLPSSTLLLSYSPYLRLQSVSIGPLRLQIPSFFEFAHGTSHDDDEVHSSKRVLVCTRPRIARKILQNQFFRSHPTHSSTALPRNNVDARIEAIFDLHNRCVSVTVATRVNQTRVNQCDTKSSFCTN